MRFTTATVTDMLIYVCFLGHQVAAMCEHHYLSFLMATMLTNIRHCALEDLCVVESAFSDQNCPKNGSDHDLNLSTGT